MDNKEKINVYVNAMLESFAEKTEVGTAYDAIRDDYGMEGKSDKEIEESLRDELLLKAEENIIEYGEPELTMDELNSIFIKVATRLALDTLIEKGLINSTFDPEKMENVFSLTEKGFEINKDLFK